MHIHKIGKSDYYFGHVCLSVYPSVFMEQLGFLDGFSWNLIFGYLLKLCWENSSLIKMWRMTGLLHEYVCIFMIIPHCILLRMRNVSGSSCRGNQNWHFRFNNFPKNLTIYEIMWKKYGAGRQASDDNILWQIHTACWITKDNYTHSGSTYCFAMATMVMWMCLHVTFLHMLPVFFFFLILFALIACSLICEQWYLFRLWPSWLCYHVIWWNHRNLLLASTE